MTVLIFVLSSANAAPAAHTVCSGDYSIACECVRAAGYGSDWWGGIDHPAAAEDRDAGTCFDLDVVEASVPSAFSLPQKQTVLDFIRYKGTYVVASRPFSCEVDGVTVTETYDWQWDSGTRVASLVSAQCDGQIGSAPPVIPPGGFPGFNSQIELVGGDYQVRDPETGAPIASVPAGGAAPISATFLDIDGDLEGDLILGFENGEHWQVMGPLPPGASVVPPAN